MKTPQILIVDDELNICQSCIKILAKLDCEAHYALNGKDALSALKRTDYQVLITDLKMSRMGGMEVLRRVKQSHPYTQVIVITGYASVASAVEVMKLGAFDYLPKPFTPHELRTVVSQALEANRRRKQNRHLKQQPSTPKTVSHQLIGSSSKIKHVISMVQKVAPTDATVMVYGESGTGKELIARAVHANSRRKDQVFFAVDCGTLSGPLLESELFGHVKGAFTGAHQDKDGIFKNAHQGTVFLDEISNIGLDVQGKLLRFLETREFLPVGSTSAQKVDVRLIFATNQDLEKMVASGEFRQDFYYRIVVYPVLLPPLRARKSDILPIAYHFLRFYSSRMNKSIHGIRQAAANRLMAMDWPGNVRQLRNVIERAVILCEEDYIRPQDLALFGEMEDLEHLIETAPASNEELKQRKKEIRRKAVQKLEKKFLIKALKEAGWNITRAARNTGMQRTNFQSLMKKNNVALPRRNP